MALFETVVGLSLLLTLCLSLYAFLWVVTYKEPVPPTPITLVPTVSTTYPPEPLPHTNTLPFWHNSTAQQANATPYFANGDVSFKKLNHLGVTIKQLGYNAFVKKDGSEEWVAIPFHLKDLCYFPVLKCFLGINESDSGLFIRSYDGFTWGVVNGPFHNLYHVGCTLTHVAILRTSDDPPNDQDKNSLLITTDLETWTEQAITGNTKELKLITYDTVRDLCLVINKDGNLYESSDMTTWTLVLSTDGLPRILLCNPNGMMMACSYTKLFIRKSGLTDPWVEITSIPTNHSGALNELTHFDSHDNLWILSAEDLILRSTDEGDTWFRERTKTFKAIARNATTCVAVGESIHVGASWNTLRPVESKIDRTDQTALVWDGELELFVMLGNNSRLLTSPDGVEWTDVMDSATGTTLRHVQGKTFVLGAQLHIFDGDDTFANSFPLNPGAASFRDMAETTEALLVVGDQGDGKMWRSTDDGVNWTEVDLSEFYLVNKPIRTVAANGAICVAGGSSGLVLRSTDAGVTWTELTDFRSPYDNLWIRYANGHFLMLDSFAGTVWRSVSGDVWTHYSNIPDTVWNTYSPCRQFTYDAYQQRWIVCDYDEQQMFLSTDNGRTWSKTKPVLPENFAIYYDNDKWAMQTMYRNLTSLDSYHWKAQSSHNFSNIDAAVAIGSAAYYVSGNGLGSIFKTADGVNDTHLSHIVRYVRGLSGLANGVLIVVGKRHIMRSEDDGATWNQVNGISPPSKEFASIYDAVNGNCCTTNHVDTFVVQVMDRSQLVVSVDTGRSWNLVATPTRLTSICWTGQEFVGLGRYHTLCFSPDGVTWEIATVPLNLVLPEQTTRVVSTTSGILYLTYTSSEGVGGYVSTDRGVTWSAIRGFYTYSDTNIGVTMVNNRLVLYNSTQVYHYSADAQDYSVLSPKAPVRAVTALGDNQCIVFGGYTDRTVYTKR
jgi:photosystem II stability/assembly factor-like uncharacterized protein